MAGAWFLGAMADNMEELVPVFASLAEVYEAGPRLEEQTRRYENLRQEFQRHFGREPDLFARAPGMLTPWPSERVHAVLSLFWVH